jgi:sec-independent protein translocase protein TatC
MTTPPLKTMALSAHLEELRLRLIFSLLVFTVTSLLAFYYADFLLKVVIDPFLAIMEEKGFPPKVVQNSIASAFMAHIKIAVIAGFFFSSPFLFYQLWAFIGAGLYPDEKRYVYLFTPISIGCFLLGVLFFYFLVLPFGLRYLLAYGNTPENAFIEPLIHINDLLYFFALMALVLGLVFELPVLMGFLIKIGMTSSRSYQKHRKLFIVIAPVIGAVLTPPDVATQLAVSIPLVLLYEVGILLARHLEGENVGAWLFLIALTPFSLILLILYASQNILGQPQFSKAPLEPALQTLLFEKESWLFFSPEEIEPLFVRITQDPDPSLRIRAYQKLAQLKKQQALLENALEKDPQWSVQFSVSAFLYHEFQSKKGGAFLLRALENPQFYPRFFAFQLLKQWSGNDFGYRAESPPEEQKDALKRWDSWYQEWIKN